MKIFADENIPQMTIQALRAGGNDVKDIRGTIDEGIEDEAIWEMVIKEKRLLITTDKGFGHFRNELHTGILIVLFNAGDSPILRRRMAWKDAYHARYGTKSMGI